MVRDRILSPKIGIKMRVLTLIMPIQHHIGSPKQGNKARKRNTMHKTGKHDI